MAGLSRLKGFEISQSLSHAVCHAWLNSVTRSVTAGLPETPPSIYLGTAAKTPCTLHVRPPLSSVSVNDAWSAYEVADVFSATSPCFDKGGAGQQRMDSIVQNGVLARGR